MSGLESLVEGSRWVCIRRKHRGHIREIKRVGQRTVLVEDVGLGGPRQHRNNRYCLTHAQFLHQHVLVDPGKKPKGKAA